MDERLQEMLDHHEIKKTLAEYCHGCDRADEPHMASIYAAESWDDHGDIKAPGTEFAEKMTARIIETTETLSHLLGQSMITVNGDEAGAETYFLAVAKTARGDGKSLCNQLGGRYVDTLVRENGRWLVKHRAVVKDWAISLPIDVDWTERVGLIDGQRSNADPSYAALGLRHSGIPARAA
jgi:hypothetical protein